MPIVPIIQRIGVTKKFDRSKHVWHDRKDGSYKCVLCGGITAELTENDTCPKYEKVTVKERALCPKRF